MTWVRENTDISATQVQGWLTEGLQSILKSAASLGGSVALGVFGTLVGFFMMLFMLFFFLRDGRTMLEHSVQLIPVQPARRAQLLKYLGEVTRAVVFGSAADRGGAGRDRRASALRSPSCPRRWCSACWPRSPPSCPPARRW